MGAWKEASDDWRPGATRAVAKLGRPDLTVVDADGFPVPFPVKRVVLVPEGFRLELPAVFSAPAQAVACLTFHKHDYPFTRQENTAFVGQVEPGASEVVLRVERQLGDWSLGETKLQGMLNFFSAGRKVAPRLATEAARRGQPVPKINLP